MHKNLIFTDGTQLQVGVMYGIGQNYAKHAKEMNSTIPTEPVIFIKPPSAYVPDGSKICPPHISINVHHEVELVVVIGKECIKVSRENAHEYIAGYAVGIDATLRDIQNKAKAEGKPWSVSKGFATSGPISRIIPAKQINRTEPSFNIELMVNNELKQFVNTGEMERPVSVLIEYISDIFGLYPGDCIFTGTPEGVGRIISGDKLHAELKGYTTLDVEVE